MPGSGVTGGSPLTVGETDDFSWLDNGKVIAFDQREFVPRSDWPIANLHTHGLVYIPDACVEAEAGCKVVFALPGCDMNASMYMNNGMGYVQTASWNDLILVIPVPRMSCFNVDGNYASMSRAPYDDDWNNNEGIQVKALKGMMDRVLEPLDSTYRFDRKNIIKHFDKRYRDNWNEFQWWLYDMGLLK